MGAVYREEDLDDFDDRYKTVPLLLNEPPPARSMNSAANAAHNARAAFVALLVVVGLRNIDPYLFITDFASNNFRTIAMVSGYGEWLAYTFAAAVVMTLPFLGAQLLWPRCRHRKDLQRLCIAGLYLSGCCWGFMVAMLSLHQLDMGSFWWVLLRGALSNLFFASILAISLNNERLAEWLEGR